MIVFPTAKKLLFRYRLILSISVLMVALTQILVSLKPWTSAYQPLDFMVYRVGVQAWLNGAHPYGMLAGLESGMRFLYPPGSLLLLAPFGILPEQVSVLLFFCLSVLSLLVVIYQVVSLESSKFSIAALLLVAAFALQTFPVKFTLGLGQINLIVLALTTSAIVLQTRKNYTWAGILLAVSITLKPFAILLFVWWAWRRHFRLVIVSGITIILLNIWHVEYLQHFLALSGSLTTVIPGEPSVYNQSLSSLFMRFGMSGQMSFVLSWVVFFVGIGSIWCIQRKNHQIVYFLLALTILQFGNAWHHYLVMAYPWLLTQKIWWTLPVSWVVLLLHFSTSPTWMWLVSVPVLYMILLRTIEVVAEKRKLPDPQTQLTRS